MHPTTLASSPKDSTFVSGHRRWVAAAYWRALNVQGSINAIPQPA
jgi:hypothetical protein